MPECILENPPPAAFDLPLNQKGIFTCALCQLGFVFTRLPDKESSDPTATFFDISTTSEIDQCRRLKAIANRIKVV